MIFKPLFLCLQEKGVGIKDDKISMQKKKITLPKNKIFPKKKKKKKKLASKWN